MAFDAGSLVATLRMAGLSAFSADAATAKRQFLAIGASADAAGAAGERVGKRAQAGATVSVRAMQDAAAKQTAAAERAAQAQIAAAEKAAARAAAAAETAAAKEAAAAEKASARAVAAEQKKAAAAEAAAAKEVAAAEAGAAKAAAAQVKAAELAGRKNLDVQRQVGVGATAFGVVAVAGFALAAKATADYQAKMAQLQSLSKATAPDMARLSEAAMEQGKAYGYSASQVADAEIELTKAGLSTQQILGGGLKSALTTAAAGQLDVGKATEISTIAMTDFGLKAEELPHVSDLLAAGADKALGSVGDLGEALSNGGQQAHNMGLGIDDTIGVLAAFANAGILGAEAGTQLRSMFIQLQHITPQAQAVLDKYGISIYDQQGKFVGLSKLAGELNDHLGNLSQAEKNAALATVFGSHAITGASVLMQLGSKGVDTWRESISESGFASAQAAGKLNSLQGDVQKLAASFQTDLIKGGTGANGMLRNLTKSATGLLDGVSSIPTPVLATAAALTVATGAVAVLGGALLLGRVKLAQFRIEAAAANVSVGSFGKGLLKGAAVSVGLSALIAGLSGVAQQGQATTQQIAQTGQAAREQFGDLDKLFQNETTFGGAKNGFKNALDFEGLGSAVQKFGSLGGAIGAASESVLKNEGVFDALGQQLAGLAQKDLPAAQAQFSGIASRYHLTADQQKKLLDLMGPYRDEIAKQVGLTNVAANDQNVLAGALGKGAAGHALAEHAASGATKALEDQAGAARGDSVAIASLLTESMKLAKSQQDLEGSADSALDAVQSFSDGVQDAAKQGEKGARSLDQQTAAGRKNRESINAAAQAIQAHASSLNADGKHASEAAVYQLKMAQSLEESAVKAGISKKAAHELIATLLGLPKDASFEVQLKDAAFQQKLADTRAKMEAINGLTSDVYINAIATGKIDGATASRINRQATTNRAGGGDLDQAPGPKGQDSQLFWGAKGEHVLTAGDVDAMGGQAQVYAFRRGLHAGVAGYARGGALGNSQDLGSAADSRVAADDRKIAAAKRDLTKLRKAAKEADRAADKASDSSADIYGKGSGPAKHAAAMRARDLKKRAEALDKKVTASEKALQKLQDDRSKQQDKADAQQERRTSLTEQKQDLGFSLQQGNLVDASDPYGAFGQALSASRDANFTSSQRNALYASAKTQGAVIAGLVKSAATATASFEQQQTDASKQLQDQADRTQAAIDSDNDALSDMNDKAQNAASALQQVQSAFDSLNDQTASTISGFFDLSSTLADAESVTTSLSHNAGTAAQWDEKVTTTTAGGATIGSIRAASGAAADQEQAFASQLADLVRAGYSTAVVQDVARQGVDKGSQLAAALLSGTADDVGAVNSNYARSAQAGSVAGVTVATQAYGTQLAAANAAADYAQQQVSLAQQQLTQDQALAVQQQKDGQARLDALTAAQAAATASSNAAIQAAQQSIVTALQNALGSTGAATKKKADGGIVERFALGGFRPSAHIVPAGANRILYGEPETGGEAFIPLAPAKRTRSLSILNETARRMGQRVTAMADGGILAGTAAGGGDYVDLRGAQFVNTSEQDVRNGMAAALAARKGKIMGTALRRPKP